MISVSHQRDTDSVQLVDVDKLLDGFHQFLRTFLPVPHYRLTACSALFGKPVVEKVVHGKQVRWFNHSGFSLSGGIIDHHTDGVHLVVCTALEKS